MWKCCQFFFILKLGKHTRGLSIVNGDGSEDENEDENSVDSKISDISSSTNGTKCTVKNKSKYKNPFEYAGRRPNLNDLSQYKCDQLTLSKDESYWKRLPLNASANEIDRSVSFSSKLNFKLFCRPFLYKKML